MKMVKMFTREEIQKAINDIDVLKALYYYGGNDVAFYHYINDPKEDFLNDDEKKLTEYLIQQGCQIDEKIWIDVTW